MSGNGFNYTVGANDRGLTQIFLDAAKKAASDAGKVFNTKNIKWNSVMDAFKKIQQQEKAKGSKLYSGGEDTTKNGWGNSFVISAGQEINLSQEQLNMIYNAMGLDLGNSQVKDDANVEVVADVVATEEVATEAEEDVAEVEEVATEAEEDVAEVEEVATEVEDVADENLPPAKSTPPSKVDNVPSETSLPDAFNSVEVAMLSKPYPNYANQAVKIDGQEIFYNEDGFAMTFENADNKVTGYIDRETDGSVKYFIDYERDSQGNVTREIQRNPDGSVEYCNDYKYDSQRNVIRDIFYDSAGFMKQCRDFEWDDQEKITRVIDRDIDGSVENFFDFEYDNQGRRTKLIHRDKDGQLISYKLTTYSGPDDANGTEVWYDKDHNEITDWI